MYTHNADKSGVVHDQLAPSTDSMHDPIHLQVLVLVWGVGRKTDVVVS